MFRRFSRKSNVVQNYDLLNLESVISVNVKMLHISPTILPSVSRFDYQLWPSVKSDTISIASDDY